MESAGQSVESSVTNWATELPVKEREGQFAKRSKCILSSGEFNMMSIETPFSVPTLEGKCKAKL